MHHAHNASTLACAKDGRVRVWVMVSVWVKFWVRVWVRVRARVRVRATTTRWPWTYNTSCR